MLSSEKISKLLYVILTSKLGKSKIIVRETKIKALLA